ncbi:MAG: hypothetical protein HY266_10820 [Deltaproteobacteria bacterium]|nr:hypothetical protein [Deltaproteobacteria bacterium]
MAEKTIAEQQIQKRKYWKRQIEGWRRAGSSQAEYCRVKKLSAKSFTYWKSRFRQKSEVSFVPVEVKPEAEMADNSSGLVLCKDGYRIEIKEGFKAEALGKVLLALRELSC